MSRIRDEQRCIQNQEVPGRRRNAGTYIETFAVSSYADRERLDRDWYIADWAQLCGYLVKGEDSDASGFWIQSIRAGKVYKNAARRVGVWRNCDSSIAAPKIWSE